MPVGGRELLGYVLEVPTPGAPDLKEILAVIDGEPAFAEQTARLIEWIAAEYCCSPSDALPLFVPQSHEERLETWLLIAPGWDGTLRGRAGPVTALAARAIHQALASAGGSMARKALLEKLPQPNVPAALRRCRDEGPEDGDRCPGSRVDGTYDRRSWHLLIC